MSYLIVTSVPREHQIPVSLPRSPLSRLFGHGLEPEDLLLPALLASPELYNRGWVARHSEKDAGSTVAVDKDKFQVNLDVQQFKPEEISVKVTGDNTITVEGKHEERQDDHGFISRHFVRRYVVPKGHDVSKVESKLSSDGVLSISVAKESNELGEHRSIPITQTGQPLKPAVEQKSEEKKE